MPTAAGIASLISNAGDDAAGYNRIRGRPHQGDLPLAWQNARLVGDARTIHEFVWLSEINSVEGIMRHHAKTLKLPTRQRDAFIASRKGWRCGKGRSIHLTSDLINRFEGRARVGGKESIYLLSESGESGALRLSSSHYQSYDVTKFRIERDGVNLTPVRHVETPFSLCKTRVGR